MNLPVVVNSGEWLLLFFISLEGVLITSVF